MSAESPLFQLKGLGMAAQFSKEDGSSIGILTLTTDSGHINFAIDVHGAQAIINAMNSYLEAAASHAGNTSVKTQSP